MSGLTDEDGDGSSDDLAPGASAAGDLLMTLTWLGAVTNTATASGQDVTSSGDVYDTDTATVTVTNAPPAIHDCPDDLFVPNPDKKPAVIATWTPPSASDPSGVPPTLVSTHNPGDSFPVGVTMVTYTATDAQGATSTCSFEITVENNTPPVIEIQVPQDDAVFLMGEDVRVRWDATSNLPLADVRATMASGQLLDTSQGGRFEFEVTATDITGISATESVEWSVLFLLRPPASANVEWTEEWLWIDKVLPLNERMLIGSVPISGVYASGEPVTVFFALCDIDGHDLRDCVASLSVTRARDPEDDTRYEDLLDYMLKFYTFRFDWELAGYYFELQTFGYQPGYYDLWITVDSLLQQRVRIQILGSRQ